MIWDVQFYEIWGVNGVAMARNGLILWQNEAVGSRKVFRYLPGLWDTIKKSKMLAKVRKSKNVVFYRILLYIGGLKLSISDGGRTFCLSYFISYGPKLVEI